MKTTDLKTPVEYRQEIERLKKENLSFESVIREMVEDKTIADALVKRIKSLNKEKKPEYSDWYDYRGGLDFEGKEFVNFWNNRKTDGTVIESKYRIKLGDVRVIKYERIVENCIYDSVNRLFYKHDAIGHDPHNKIIIIKDSE